LVFHIQIVILSLTETCSCRGIHHRIECDHINFYMAKRTLTKQWQSER